jgi:NADPH-dependent glutamate synthase beta subunit-like oxidoreductase
MVGGFLIMGLLGTVIGVGLALASKIFYVYVDPKIEAVEDALPGANCGGCGLPGCSSNAEAIVRGEAAASSCVAGGEEIALEIAEIMGVKIEAREPDIALPGCSYGLAEADIKFIYNGVNDCRAAMLLNGGTKVCYAGCLGLGTCVEACPFGALSIGDDSLPVVDEVLCTGCGTCERVCPKHIITLSSNSRKIQREHTTYDCTTPCQRACPAGIDISGYIHEIAQGRYLEAVRVIKLRNPFPSVCGRICVHPCEDVCRRNLVDASVAINDLKRFATDYERASAQRVQVPRAPETGREIAVVGGGAEGLTAAYFLNRLGHDATVYESTSRLGGLLRTGLPENRLPREIIDWDIDSIIDAGVAVKKAQQVGKDFTIGSLIRQGASAVFVATGGWDTRMSERATGGVSQPIPGVQLLVDYVLDIREGKSPSVGDSVMILGGGHAALEAAGAAKEAGAAVCVVLRSSKALVPVSDEALDAAEGEGIRIIYEAALSKMLGEGDSLRQVEVMAASGRGEAEVISVDTLLTGAGRFPELIYVPRVEGEETQTPQPVDTWQTVVPYAGPFATDDVGLFRDGEVTSDYKAVIEAIGAGRRAASSVQKYLSDEPVEAPFNMIRTFTHVVSLDSLEPVPQAPREKMPELSQEKQILDPAREIALGFSQDQASKESKRCLKCGIICYRRTKKGALH